MYGKLQAYNKTDCYSREILICEVDMKVYKSILLQFIEKYYNIPSIGVKIIKLYTK